jgi:hypothetical protein
MIRIETETVRPLAAWPRRLPRRPRGRPISLATLYRWSTIGCRGVVLETLQVGGTRCTSLEALQRFFDRLSSAGREPAPSEAGARQSASARRRQREDAVVEAELERLGL